MYTLPASSLPPPPSHSPTGRVKQHLTIKYERSFLLLVVSFYILIHSLTPHASSPSCATRRDPARHNNFTLHNRQQFPRVYYACEGFCACLLIRLCIPRPFPTSPDPLLLYLTQSLLLHSIAAKWKKGCVSSSSLMISLKMAQGLFRVIKNGRIMQIHGKDTVERWLPSWFSSKAL